MDCYRSGGVTVVGNFSKRTDRKPDSFDYMTTAKWYEPYTFECREQIGQSICDCERVKVNYAPYYGFDYYHSDDCILMKRIAQRPQLTNLPAFSYLPALYLHSNPNCKHLIMESCDD